MEKKIYALKNGDNPGICIDWLSFFERIDGMDQVVYKAFVYRTELEEADAEVESSLKWAFKMAKDFLAAD